MLAIVFAYKGHKKADAEIARFRKICVQNHDLIDQICFNSKKDDVKIRDTEMSNYFSLKDSDRQPLLDRDGARITQPEMIRLEDEEVTELPQYTQRSYGTL